MKTMNAEADRHTDVWTNGWAYGWMDGHRTDRYTENTPCGPQEIVPFGTAAGFSCYDKE